MRRFGYVILVIFLYLVVPRLDGQNLSTPGTISERPLQIFSAPMVAQHRLTSIQSLRTSSLPNRLIYGLPLFSVDMEITIDKNGNVTDASPDPETSDRPDFFPAAIAEARTWKYMPFMREGKPVAATFEEQIPIFLAEKPPVRHISFPRIHDRNSLRIELEYQRNPNFSLEIRGNGTVTYVGRTSPPLLLIGEHRDRISQGALEQLVEAFRRANFFSLDEKYQLAGRNGPPDYAITISFDGKKKSVSQHDGMYVGMPHVLTELEKAIRQVSGAERWILGNKDTVPSLLREGYNFKSAQAAEDLYQATRQIEIIPTQVILEIIAAGVPVDIDRPLHECFLAAAVPRKNLKLLDVILQGGGAYVSDTCNDYAIRDAIGFHDVAVFRKLVESGVQIRSEDNDAWTILMRAAETGDPEMVAEILKHAVDPNAATLGGQSPLRAAVTRRNEPDTDDERRIDESARLQIVRLLLKAGADLKVPLRDETTLLHVTNVEDIARLLIENGADVNARDSLGRTPLMTTYSAKVARLLLQSGAELHAVDRHGRTALDQLLAIDMSTESDESGDGLKEKLELLRAAAAGELAQK